MQSCGRVWRIRKNSPALMSSNDSCPKRSSEELPNLFIVSPCAVEQAGVAIGIEPVAAADGVGIGPLHGVEPAEGRHQHEQRRTRQMKIGQENIDRAKAVAGRDED